MRKTKNEIPRKKRQFGVFLTFDTVEEKESVYHFINTEGRAPASYIKYLLVREMQRSGRNVVGKPVSPDIFGA